MSETGDKTLRKSARIFWLWTASMGLLVGFTCDLSAESAALAVQHVAASHAVAQGYLGVDVRDVSADRIGALRLKDAHGAEIIRVDHDGPAGKMGLREHDVVLRMNGVLIEGEEPLRRMLRETAPGNAVVLLISREGLALTLTATMADRAQVERQAWEQHLVVQIAGASGPQAPASALPSWESSPPALAEPSGPAPMSRYSKSFLGTLLPSPSYTGLEVQTMGPQLAEFFGVPGSSGLLVRSVRESSPAEIAGLRAGDIIVKANARAMRSVNDWAKTVRAAKGRPISVVVMRDRHEKTLTVTPDGKKRSELELPFEPLDEVRTACLAEL